MYKEIITAFFLFSVTTLNAQQYMDIPIQTQSQVIEKIATHYYSIKNSSVYYANKLIEGADAHTFIILPDDVPPGSLYSHTYGKDKNRVYYMGVPINKINPETIIVLSSAIAKDDKHVIWNGSIVDNMDAASFIIVNAYFVRDKNHVYNQASFRPVEGADAGTIYSINDKYSKDKNQVYLEYGIIAGADPKTFRITENDSHYLVGKDRKRVYIGRTLLEGSHPKSFRLLKDGYMKDKGQVYYNYRVLKNADPATFAFIQDRNGYTRDKNHIYYGGQLLEGINPDSMTFSGNYLWGQSCVYFVNQQIRFVDIGSFQVLSTRIAKDKNNIYYGSRVAKLSISGMEPELDSFSAVPVTHSGVAASSYFRDRRRVFYLNNRAEFEHIAIADPGSFVEIHIGHGKDRRYVYIGNRWIDADPETFVLDTHDINYATDKDRAYYAGKPLEQSDPSTFEIIPYTPYSKDAVNVWHYAHLIPGADAQTFTRAQGDYFKDKNAVYYGGWKLPDVDPETFDPDKLPYKPVKLINPAM